MNEEVRELTYRLGRLERENKQLKRWAAGMCAGFALLGLLGMAAPAICDVVSGERLVLRDSGGRQRLVVDTYQSETPTLTLQSREGRTLAKLGIDERGEAYFNLYDKQGASKAAYSTAAPSSSGAPARAEPAKPDTKGSADPATVVSND